MFNNGGLFMKTGWIMGLAVFLAAGCDDIFEKDITGREVSLTAPADSVETAYGNQVFVWQGITGAAGYRLVVVRPSFREAELYVLDTLVDECSFRFALDPGSYEWGVRPENSVYEGEFSRRRLTVLECADGKPEEP